MNESVSCNLNCENLTIMHYIVLLSLVVGRNSVIIFIICSSFELFQGIFGNLEVADRTPLMNIHFSFIEKRTILPGSFAAIFQYILSGKYDCINTALGTRWYSCNLQDK